jgi:hypothetical protein
LPYYISLSVYKKEEIFSKENLKEKEKLSKENLKEKEKLVTGPDCGLTPGQTGRVTVGRKKILTLIYINL